MKRDDLIRAIRRYCRTRGLRFEVDERTGNGSHYKVKAGERRTIVQYKLNPHIFRMILKQLDIDPADL